MKFLRRDPDRARLLSMRPFGPHPLGHRGLSAQFCSDPGTLCRVVLLLVAGLVTFDLIWQAVMLAGIYLLIHIAEGEVVTPMLLARRST